MSWGSVILPAVAKAEADQEMSKRGFDINLEEGSKGMTAASPWANVYAKYGKS